MPSRGLHQIQALGPSPGRLAQQLCHAHPVPPVQLLARRLSLLRDLGGISDLGDFQGVHSTDAEKEAVNEKHFPTVQDRLREGELGLDE